MPTILITGASSGLGLSFLQHYLTTDPQNRIIALDQSPLPDPLSSNPHITFHKTDITSPANLQEISFKLNKAPISLLIHCAGIRGLVQEVVAKNPGDVAAAETMVEMNKTTMMATLEVNTWGTFSVIQSFLVHLLLSQQQSSVKPKAVILSSRMGSVTSNSGGGGYAYRASKAALNAVVKSFSVDVPQVRFLLLHPGRVETGLVEWKEEGAIGVQESVRDCVGVIEGKWESGSFVDRWGVQIPW